MFHKISTIVENQFPQFFREEGENLVAFTKAYYEYLEQSGKLSHGIENLSSYRDITETTDDYIEYFRQELLPNIPQEVLADKRLLAKNIRDFYRSRGSAQSYKFLFRVLYNEDVELYYPSEQILKVSDGDYRIDRYLVTNYNRNLYPFIGKTIKGGDSQAEALVEQIVRRVVRGRDIMQILVSNVNGQFNHLEPVYLKSDTAKTGTRAVVEAGIANVTIESPGGSYVTGDVVKLISDKNGDFGKVVVSGTVDLGGSLSFAILDSGSGYTSSVNIPGTTITFVGGDGIAPPSFDITQEDLTDLFAISMNTNFVGDTNIFSTLAPTIDIDGAPTQMTKFEFTPLSCPDFGFPEADQDTSEPVNFRDHANAVINIANTQTIKIGDSIYNMTDGSANGTVLTIVSATAGNTAVRIDGYRNWTPGDTIRTRFANTSGNSVGTVVSFQGNTIGYHVIQIGNLAGQSVTAGMEIVGRQSGAFGVIKKVLTITPAGYEETPDRDLIVAQVTANSSANLSSQFHTGPMKPFIENEGLRTVGSNTSIGNVVFDTSNTTIENVYTRLSDSLIFSAATIGGIERISSQVGGSGFSVAPTILVRENNIAALGIGEAYLTLQSNNVNWLTGNSSFVKCDTNDRLVQASSGASGDVKGGDGSAVVNVINHANGIYEMVVRVWQDFNQREPGGIEFANNETVSIQIYDSSYLPGEGDDRTPTDSGTAKIVHIRDEGVLGKNANIRASVGANGTITSVRVLDSGFCYRHDEEVSMEATDRDNATSARLVLSMHNVANGEGYYYTTRGHISSSRGYLQDSYYYQEFSYEVASSLSINKYRDIILKLVHPAGQAVFGKYKSQSNTVLDLSADSELKKRTKLTGSVAVANGSFGITGTGTSFLSAIANNGILVIEKAPNVFYRLPINKVANNTSANASVRWSNTSIATANVYYFSGDIE